MVGTRRAVRVITAAVMLLGTAGVLPASARPVSSAQLARSQPASSQPASSQPVSSQPAAATPAQVRAAGPSELRYVITHSRLVRPGRLDARVDAAQYDADAQHHAFLVVRTYGGERVSRERFTPTCEDQEGGCDLQYRLRWDGRNDAGALLRSRAYRAYGYFVDKAGRTLKVSLGSFSIQHLVTRTVTRERSYPRDTTLRATRYDVVGACSSVEDDDSWSGLWLRSLSEDCPDPQPGDDRVGIGLQSFANFGTLTVPAGLGFDRLVRLRFEVYGESGRPGSTLTVGVQDSTDRRANVFVDLPGSASGPVGWHALDWYTVDPAVLGGRTDPAFRLQVADGSHFHVRFVRATYVVRAWVTG